MLFTEAINAICDGKHVRRKEWPNKKDYCLLQNTKLTIFIGGKFHDWVINDGDLLAEDWQVV